LVHDVPHCTSCTFTSKVGRVLDTEAAPSRRERKKSATREALHEAALSLTEERGLAAVTVDAIADRADVATRTFFNHFGTKVDAVLGRDPDRGERLAQAVEDRPAGDSPLEVLRDVLVDDIARRDATVSDLLRRMRVVRSEPALLAALSVSCEDVERQMTDAVARRVGVDPAIDVYPSLLVVASLNAVRVAMLRWCDQGGDRPVETLVHHVFDQLAAGLSRPLVAAGAAR
jgi:AcrR family transcriptional regulator